MANPKGNEATLTKFQPKWRSGKTQTIRVPIAIADLVLEAAQEIDNNGNKSLLQVIKESRSEVDKEGNQLVLEIVQAKDKLISGLKKQLSTVTSERDELLADKANQSKNTDTSDSKLINEVLEILKHGVTPKRQGGAYTSNNSKLLKEDVLKAITILENLTECHK